MMTFESVVTCLCSHHDQLWFRTAGGTNVTQDASAWRESEILTTGGRIVAMQTGLRDEWQLTPGADRPDNDFPEDVPSRAVPLGEAVVIAERRALLEQMGNDLPVRPLKRMGAADASQPARGRLQKDITLNTFTTDPQAEAFSRSLDSACLITCLNVATAAGSLSALLLLTAVENLSTAGFVVKVTMALLFPVSTVSGIFHLLKYLRLLREGPVSGETR